MNPLLGLYSCFSRVVSARKAALYARGRKVPLRPPLAVIGVGNLGLGGSGKTPLVMELVGHFQALGRRPALVSRGYRGTWEKDGGVLSDGTALRAGWREGGDEPFMVARRFPKAGVFVGRHRFASCLKAREMGFDVILLDDGFQHLRLARDLDIVLHDPSSRGPLREGESALARADVLLLRRGAGSGTVAAYRELFPGLIVLEYEVAVRGLVPLREGPEIPAGHLRGKRVLAVSGIARPDRFTGLLEALDAGSVKAVEFPDHYAYQGKGRARIAAAVRRASPDLVVTTEKDAVKLDDGRDDPFAGTPAYFLRIGLDLPEELFAAAAAAVRRFEERRG